MNNFLTISASEPFIHAESITEYGRYQRLLPFLREFQYATIVDAGCSFGHTTRWVKDTFPSSRVIGMDIDTQRFAKRAKSDPSIEYMQGDFYNLDTLINGADLVLCMNNLHYAVPELSDETLLSIRRSLTRSLVDTGHLIIGSAFCYSVLERQNQDLVPLLVNVPTLRTVKDGKRFIDTFGLSLYNLGISKRGKK